MNPIEALEHLKRGNFRFVNAVFKDRDYLEKIKKEIKGQWPFAVIVSCMDSRNPVELIFDQGIGDLLSLRMAGNLIREDMLGSLEFACKIIGARLIVVMGHTDCGAIKGACDALKMGHITKLLSYIMPAIDQEKTIVKQRNSSNVEFVEKVCDINIQRNMDYILANSTILKEMVDKKKLLIIAAKYDVATGLVRFF